MWIRGLKLFPWMLLHDMLTMFVDRLAANLEWFACMDMLRHGLKTCVMHGPMLWTGTVLSQFFWYSHNRPRLELKGSHVIFCLNKGEDRIKQPWCLQPSWKGLLMMVLSKVPSPSIVGQIYHLLYALWRLSTFALVDDVQ